ncbi:MAG TPA: hypothetical protein ENI98_05600 [Gammaproteobacteria bacterium]|nr:hypothetical protein [Gammaproteobacteria bacterium]
MNSIEGFKMSDECKEEIDEEGYVDGCEQTQKDFWGYIQTKRGHEVLKNVLSMLSDVKNVATQAMMEEKHARLQADLHYRKFQSIIQLSVYVIGLIVVSFLTYQGKFESGIAVLIGTLVGYFFGKGRSS